jgi:hypothetical protein
MKTTLVNHSGIIQEKFLIKTQEDVLEYQKISARQNGEHLLDSSGKPSTIRDAIINLAELSGESLLITAIRMTDAKVMSLSKEVSEGRVAVINMAGGWTTWDDKVMSLVDESNRKINSSDYSPVVNIGTNKILVLENQESISKNVTDFIKDELNEDNYSYVIRLNTDYNNQIGDWIAEAIHKGCKTIIFETQLADKSQIQKMIKLFSSLPPITFHVFTSGNLKNELERYINVETIAEIYKRHTIHTY